MFLFGSCTKNELLLPSTSLFTCKYSEEDHFTYLSLTLMTENKVVSVFALLLLRNNSPKTATTL